MNTGSSVTTTTKRRRSRAPAAKAQRLPADTNSGARQRVDVFRCRYPDFQESGVPPARQLQGGWSFSQKTAECLLSQFNERKGSVPAESRLPLNRRPKVGSSTSAPGSQSFVTKVIEFSRRSESTAFVTGSVSSVRSFLCRLLLLVGAMAKAKATAGTLPCSKM